MTPGRSYISEQVVAPSRSWSDTRSFMSVGIHSVTLIVHLLSGPLRVLAMFSTHLCLLSLMFLIMSVTPLFLDPVCTLSILQGDSYHDSLHLPLGCDQFLKLGVAKRPHLTAISHYWEYIFAKYFPLQSRHIFVSHDAVQLTECTSSIPVRFSCSFLVPGHGP